eukprot:11160106-Lingulodinium_polyedra.AAC.1
MDPADIEEFEKIGKATHDMTVFRKSHHDVVLKYRSMCCDKTSKDKQKGKGSKKDIAGAAQVLFPIH